VTFVRGFFAQSESRITDLERVGVPALERMLREDVAQGWTELACHPGYMTPDLCSTYRREREEEVRTLTDPRIRATIGELGIRLASYSDFGRSALERAG
jgi:chitin disaccharide deacetylase